MEVSEPNDGCRIIERDNGRLRGSIRRYLMASSRRVALVILLLTARGSDLTKKIFSRVSSVKFLGTEVELSADTAQQITDDVIASFNAYRKLVDTEYRKQIRIHRIQSQFELVAQKVLSRVGNRQELQLRCAIQAASKSSHTDRFTKCAR